jgi:uncharacterized Ntn-hydrolase superfamily protein
MTLSILGRCPETGMLGGAVTSSSICVVSRCLFTRSRVGAALSQNITDPELGPRMLDLLEKGENTTRMVPQTMVTAFEKSSGHLAHRLISALEVRIVAGGEEGPVRSAGVQVADRATWPVVDLRVDWDEEPISKLFTIWNEYQPQLDAYVTRAIHPESAPSYGVPGDL